nr:unnamed protein product [Digitaria exilis]
MGWYGERVLRWRRMKESPDGRCFASGAAGSSTGAVDDMGRKDALPFGRRLSPAKWEAAAGDGFRMRNWVEQSINEAAAPSRARATGVAKGKGRAVSRT